MVRHPSSASRHDPKFMIKIMKHLGSVMVWRAFSGNLGRTDFYFLPKNVTMEGRIISMFQKSIFSHSGGFIIVVNLCMMMPNSQVKTKFANDHNVHVSEWRGNLANLNQLKMPGIS